MRILEVKSLVHPDVRIIRFGRFLDNRGYFTEPFRKSVFYSSPDLVDLFNDVDFLQTNESFSKSGVVRGLHFQWNPFMGKLVRTISGHMIDLFVDIRKRSPYFGKVLAYDMPTYVNSDSSEWIWVPPGFAHGNIFLKDSLIEYYCSGEYNPQCEAGISPLATDLDWSICDPGLKEHFDKITKTDVLITDKDRNGLSLADWLADQRSDNYVYRGVMNNV